MIFTIYARDFLTYCLFIRIVVEADNMFFSFLHKLSPLIFLGSMVVLHACNSQKADSQAPTNQLINQTSPYLLQHAHNPVNWYPWGEDALRKAQKENKPIIVSIGYAACHWCHVMEKESFEDDSVASLMNQYFVSIKVDREERPDIDQIYMEAAQLMTGKGGWPLNCITLPDGRPFFCGTYFPQDAWLDVLSQINKLYQENPGKLEEIAKKVTQGVNAPGLDLKILTNQEITFHNATLDSAYQNLRTDFDKKHGGYQGAPKFPVPSGLTTLMNYYFHTRNKEVLDQVTLTLDRMAMGGIYDQIGGGFARYATDEAWKVPHFEKMLYDNAQLVSVYSQAYALTKKPLYKQVVYQTLEFVRREMIAESGGFYASLDADSEGEEGRFYVWTDAEIDNILTNKAKPFKEFYNVIPKGNWEERKNILYQSEPIEKTAHQFQLPADTLSNMLKQAKAALLQARAKRVRPGLDHKTLTSWNALMIKGYADAYSVFHEAAFLEAALQAGHFLLDSTLYTDNHLNRNGRKDQFAVNAFLDDYAFTIQAFIALYQVTFDEKWLHYGENLMEYAIQHFQDKSTGYFYYTSDTDPELIARKTELYDDVIPSSNAVMAQNLFLLGQYFYNEDKLKQSRHLLSGVLPKLKTSPRYFTGWMQLLMNYTYPFYEVAVVGNDFQEKNKTIGQEFLPNAIRLGGEDEGSLALLENKLVKNKTYIYVCQNKVCNLPVTETSLAIDQITKNK